LSTCHFFSVPVHLIFATSEPIWPLRADMATPQANIAPQG